MFGYDHKIEIVVNHGRATRVKYNGKPYHEGNPLVDRWIASAEKMGNQLEKFEMSLKLS